MRHGRFLIAALAAMVILLPSAGTVLGAHPGHKLVDIRAMHHPGHDRLVFEFKGGLPHDVTATWGTDEPVYMPSGLKSAAQGNAFLTLDFAYASGHDGTPPVSTYGPTVRAYDLPNITQIKEIEDTEAALSFAIGVMKKTWVTTDTALNPPRVIVEIGTDFDRVPVKVWFGDTTAYGGAPPFMDAVTRLVPADLVAHSTLHRLFAGPTLAEQAMGLELVRSGAKDFAYLSISDTGVARVQLTGGCELGTEPISIGKEITRTLKADDVIDWVKIYDPAGETTDPHHAADSLPECLIP